MHKEEKENDVKPDPTTVRGIIKEMVSKYSEDSTIAGLVYIFMDDQTIFGRIYWIIAVVSMICLGGYWSIAIYYEWVDQQVITTASTTALPVGVVQFPAVTICANGFNYEIFHSSLIKLFFDANNISAFNIVGDEHYNATSLTPYKTSKLITKQLMNGQLSEDENYYLFIVDDFFQKNWKEFLAKNFPGLDPKQFQTFSGLDAMIQVYGMNNPDAYLRGSSVASGMPRNSTYSMLEYLLDPELYSQVSLHYDSVKEGILNGISSLKGQGVFESLMKTLWYSRLPCFDLPNITAVEDGNSAMLKKCIWKQNDIPCAAIFSTFPTDQGMCCSFNMIDADKIFVDSEFTKIVTDLEGFDKEFGFQNSTIPDWYTNANEPNTQAGINMGLEVMLDAHTDLLEAFSIDTDYDSFTALVTPPGDFPLTYQSGFRVRPGHRNMVALSAMQIQADDGIRSIHPTDRNCLFQDENTVLKLHKEYSQASCFLECSLFYAQAVFSQMNNNSVACTPWSFPFSDSDDHTVCDPWEANTLTNLLQDDIPEEDCANCLPDCNRVIYDHFMTLEPFRMCDEKNFGVSELCDLDLSKNIPKPQIWGTQVLNQVSSENLTLDEMNYITEHVQSSARVITSGVSLMGKYIFTEIDRDYDAYMRDIAILTVYFDTSTVLQFGTQATQQWVDYFANVGGLLGLCIGLSIVTCIELLWLAARIILRIIKLKFPKDDDEPHTSADLAEGSSYKPQIAWS